MAVESAACGGCHAGGGHCVGFLFDISSRCGNDLVAVWKGSDFWPRLSDSVAIDGADARALACGDCQAERLHVEEAPANVSNEGIARGCHFLPFLVVFVGLTRSSPWSLTTVMSFESWWPIAIIVGAIASGKLLASTAGVALAIHSNSRYGLQRQAIEQRPVCHSRFLIGVSGGFEQP